MSNIPVVYPHRLRVNGFPCLQLLSQKLNGRTYENGTHNASLREPILKQVGQMLLLTCNFYSRFRLFSLRSYIVTLIPTYNKINFTNKQTNKQSSKISERCNISTSHRLPQIPGSWRFLVEFKFWADLSHD